MTEIYPRYTKKYEDNPELDTCVRNTVNTLLNDRSDEDRPALMLGDIQSGKTRGFIGVMALAFDNGYEVAVVFTKGTKALVRQTVNRFASEFEDSIDQDILQVYDIMEMPLLNEWTLERQKIIIVVKKEKNNLRRLEETFFESYPTLMTKRILIIDDEADFVSIGYRKVKNDDEVSETDINVISAQISDFRSNLANGSDYLQVTATPYSLYLQPEEIQVNGEQYKPMRPRFTQLLPLHDKYIGSTYYFEHSQDEESPASCIFHPVEEAELFDIEQTHGTIRKNVLKSDRILTFRIAIVSYLTASCIRILQEERRGVRNYKTSFIIHTGRIKNTHSNQEALAIALVNALKSEIKTGESEVFIGLIRNAYDDFANSIGKTKFYLPPFDAVLEKAKEYVRFIGIKVINSKTNIPALLNARTGELKLTDPLNIFIGGQILDRGITIQNLIGFFYGRNPRRMQQDTVMQHCRVFGARSKEDMAVTRLYTTMRIYEAMSRMHYSDKALRANIEEYGPVQHVNFMRTSNDGGVVLCSPSKLLMSNVVTLQAGRRLMPYGMKTIAGSLLKKKSAKITESLNLYSHGKSLRSPFLVPLKDAIVLVNECFDQFDSVIPIAGCSQKEFIAALTYAASQTSTEKYKNQIAVFSTDELRNVSRIKENRRGRMFNDSCHDGRTDTPIIKECIQNVPCLFIPQQKGSSVNGWKADAPFYWPVLFNPLALKTAIFTTDSEDSEIILNDEIE